MFSGLDTLLQAAQFLELQEQQQQPQPQRLNSDVSIIPTNGSSSSRSVNTNSSSSSTISFIPSNSASVSESRFQPPIGKISNGTVILTASGSQNGSRILASPINTTTTALVNGLVPQGTTAYLTTTTTSAANGSKIGGQQLPSLAGTQRLHPTGTATIVPVLSSGSRKRTISNASSHSSGGYIKDEPILNGHSSSTAPPLVVISTSSSGSNGQQLLHHHNGISNAAAAQKHHPPALTIDLSTKSTVNGSHHLSHQQRLSSGTPPSASSGCSSSSTSSTLTISPVDDSQSSLNLSGSSTTSGYITSLSANSSSSLNLSGSPPGSGGCLSSSSSSSASSTSSPLPHDLVIVQQQQQQHQLNLLSSSSQQSPLGANGLLVHVPTGGRRRTVSSNSNGVGTREVHNKLEKNRRAHLKECFEQLKKQLTLQPDEKKTSNLSILHAAIRHIQVLKRKEREYEHEMERLAKEKISSQNRILVLKRELSQWGDVDFSRLAPDTDAIPTSTSSTPVGNGSATPSERDLLNDPPGVAPGRNGIRYSSSSSLSSVATTASSIGNLPLQTTISPVLVGASSSPSRASPPSATMARSSNSPAAMPLSLTTKPEQSPPKLNGLNLSNGTSGSGTTTTTLPLMVGSQSQQLFTPVTTILTTGNGSAIQTLPLNLNVTSNGHHHHSVPPNGLITSTASGLQIIGTSSTNGSTAFPLSTSAVVTNGKELINGTTANGTKNGLRTTTVSDAGGNKIEIIATQTTAGSALEPPATKVIKLVNGNTLVGLTSMDKDKMMLSQVVQQGGIVVSPIQLLTSTQGLRVIQQAPNGLATIELSSPTNVQSQPSQAHRTTGGNNGIIASATSSAPHQHLSSQPAAHHQPQQIQQVTGAQLHKLLLSSAAANGTVTSPSTTPELARLPGGAELNILPAGATNGGTTTATLPLYRTTTVSGPTQQQQQQGKLTFVNAIATAAGNGNGLTLKGTDTSGRAVHVVQSGQLSSLTPVVVSRYDHHLHHQDAGLFTTAPASGKVGALVSRN